MSIIDTGILRYLYDAARIDTREYKSSEFWQHYLKQEFNDTTTWSVTCEVPPDDSLRRVDIVVKRYDAHHHTMSALLWVECKGPAGSLREVEEQALDAAKRYIEADNNLFIYTMTTVGVSFRVWFYEKGGKALRPFHGEPTIADRSQYIDADSEYACVLPQCIDMVKEEVPLRKAPTLPSQSLADLQPDYRLRKGTADDDMWEGEDYATGESSSAQLHQVSRSDDGGAGSADDRIGKAVQAKVRREEHLLRPHEYIFKDVKGHTRRTVKKDWTQMKYHGKKVWAYHGKKTTYISDIEIK